MARLLIPLLILLGCLAALPAAAAPSSAPATSQAIAPGQANPDFMGMVIRDPWYDFGTMPDLPGRPNTAFQDSMGANLANIGVRWVRLDIHIPGGYSLPDEQVDAEIAKNDYFINEVAPRHGIKILVLLSFDLVQDANPRDLNSATAIASRFGGGVNVYMHTWLTRALRIADRYRDNVAAYEVLNEENRLPQYGSRGPAGDAIAPAVTGRLQTKFYRFCKNIEPADENHGCAPGTEIILGGVHPRGTGGSTITMTDAQYLSAIYDDASSFGDFAAKNGFYPVDGIGYHPYPQEIRLSTNDAMVDKGLARMRAVLSAKDPNQQFWITEVGYNVGFDPDGARYPLPAQTEAGQAVFMRDVYSSLAQRVIANSGQPEIANVFWFKYEDFPPAGGANAQQWGVLRIPFVESGVVNGGGCPGGACYSAYGQPAFVRTSYSVYRELSGLPPVAYSPRLYIPLVGK